MAASDQSHLNVDVLHRLMRLFMEHKTDILPIVERGRIVGEIDRLAIMEALSEIRPEGHLLSMKASESADDLLKRLDDAGVNTLATINRNFEFNALWGRAEILQAQGKIPQVKIWQPAPSPPAALPQEEANLSHPPSLREMGMGGDDIKTAPTITIVRETAPAQAPPSSAAPPRESARPAPSSEAYRGVSENLHREIERGRLATNTLAALDLPLMACDGSGVEIFHNRAFADIRMRDSLNLKSNDLVNRAKDAITEIALKGDLDIDKAVRLNAGPRGYTVHCKAIRDYDNPSSPAVGYIFWLIASGAGSSALSAGLSLRIGAGSDEVDGAGTTINYSGKTLPEILAAEEAKAMGWAMREANQNQSDAALLLGIPRQTFNYRYRRLHKARKGSARNNGEQKP